MFGLRGGGNSTTAQWLRMIFGALLLCAISSAAFAQVSGAVAKKSRAAESADAAPPVSVVSPDADDHLPATPLRSTVELVLVPVSVTDPLNRIVNGLEEKNFNVYEDGVKQPIRHFSSEDAPVSVGIVFDMSGSMVDKMDKSREAVAEFFKTANPQDEFFLLAFNQQPAIVGDFTSSTDEIEADIAAISPRGRTSLIDAVAMALRHMRRAKNEKRALLILSDGGDNASKMNDRELKSMLREADVELFAIGVFDPDPPNAEERLGPAMLNEICAETGGELFSVALPEAMPDAAQHISTALRNQYVLGYAPSHRAHDGKWRKIKVKLAPPAGLPSLTVTSRSGYYAPNH